MERVYSYNPEAYVGTRPELVHGAKALPTNSVKVLKKYYNFCPVSLNMLTATTIFGPTRLPLSNPKLLH